ncbi:MAG: chorismate synthase [Endomicrobia bacterium]|nr:chorismate synthase [Endomicrobiia bacterium]
MIRFYTAGESHNKGLIMFLEGIPSGLKISEQKIKEELIRRKKGYGRGERQNIEEERFEILSGIRYSETTGAPISIFISNKDYREKDFLGEKKSPPFTKPRPGHADFTGLLKYDRKDIKDISERSSARETVARVVAGSLCKQFLENFGVFIGSFVIKIFKISIIDNYTTFNKEVFLSMHKKAESSLLRIPDLSKEKKIIKIIDKTKKKGDTIGGDFVVFALNLPIGLGSHIQWDRRLNARVSFYIMSVPAIKSVEVGLGRDYSNYYGSEVHDSIYYSKTKGIFRKTNNAGGIEGGISNGEPLIIRCTMKPIPTLMKPLDTIDILKKTRTKADIIRSDTVAVSSCCVIAEAMLAICLAEEFIKKFGGDSLKEVKSNYNNFVKNIF